MFTEYIYLVIPQQSIEDNFNMKHVFVMDNLVKIFM